MISIENLAYRYEQSLPDVLTNISVCFEEGSFSALMGANGSGKSTLARCLNGLLVPTSGEVIVNGMSTANPDHLPAIRRTVGFVFQDPNMQMTSATIERELAFGLQNLATPQSEICNIVAEELTRLGFDKKEELSPAMLSGGEKQRLALASVLLLEPRYLVLDEPTSHLSPSSRKQMIASVRAVQKEKNIGVILITQFFDEAVQSDRLIILDKGIIVFDDIPSNSMPRSDELSARGIRMPAKLPA